MPQTILGAGHSERSVAWAKRRRLFPERPPLTAGLGSPAYLPPAAVDLFCGAGGLTRGLLDACELRCDLHADEKFERAAGVEGDGLRGRGGHELERGERRPRREFGAGAEAVEFSREAGPGDGKLPGGGDGFAGDAEARGRALRVGAGEVICEVRRDEPTAVGDLRVMSTP